MEGVRTARRRPRLGPVFALFRCAQRRVERPHYRNRVDLLVHEKQRQEVLKDLGADPYVD